MRFLVDMPVTPAAAPHLVAAGHDAVHASAVGLSTAPDGIILDVARRERRIVITADLDYPRLLALQKSDGPGIMLFRGGSYSDTEMLHLIDRVLSERGIEARLEHSIAVVDRRRIRYRSLPIEE